MPFAAAFNVGSMPTPVIVRRSRPAFVMAGGLTPAAVGFGALSQVDGPSGLTSS
jgi:MFS transporter, DHA2 family, multidrug resistance protein